MKRRVEVSDHAVLRYLERVGGFEIERLRQDLAARLQPFAGVARGAVIIDGHAYILELNAHRNAVLVTVLPPGEKHRSILKGRKGGA